MFGGFPINISGRVFAIFFLLVEVNQRRCERVGLLLRLCLGYISFVCLPFSLCLVRFDIEYAPVSVHPKSIGDVRCDKL